MMSGNSLENYYQTVFALVQHYHWGIYDLENIYPFERDIYLELLQNHLRKQEEAARNAG